MFNFDGPNGVASKPTYGTAGTEKWFTAGDPSASPPVPASNPGQDWFNMVQGELGAVVTGAGLTRDKANDAQLLAAIIALIAQSGWKTGDIKPTFSATASSGWVIMDDGTIGSASSGASTRANADTQALFLLLWANISDTWAPVVGGRGASAAADWAANKKITLPKVLGRALAGAGAGSGLTSHVLGQTLGEETHVLSTGEMPNHNHSLTDPTHFHTTDSQGAHAHTLNTFREVNNGGTSAGSTGAELSGFGGGNFPTTDIQGAHTHTAIAKSTGITIAAAGGGAAHNVMQPTVYLNFQIKL